MKIENFSASEIPYDELKVIGFTKERVLDINRDEMERFLSGGKTDLKMLNVNGLRIEAKLSLSRNPDNSVSLMIHPFQKKISNQYNFDNEEIKRLENGEIIAKNINGERALFQIDRDTNEVLSARTRGLIIPLNINSSERERLLSGKSIELEFNGLKRKLQLDLLNPFGYNLDKEQMKSRYIGAAFRSTELDHIQMGKYNLDSNNIERLLDGKRTNLIEFNNEKIKLSLSRNPDNSVSLMIHPFQKKISNQYNFDNEEIKRLENGEIIAKNINGEKVLFQIDRDTNEVLKKGELNLPSHIGDIELSSDHRERLKMGQSISLTSKNGETITAKLEFGNHSGIDIKNDLDKLKKLYMSGNLNAGAMLEKIYSGNKQQMDKFVQRNGIDSKNIAGSARAAFDRQQQYAFDYHNPGVVSYIHTDQNRAEYMAMDRGRNSSLTI